MRCLSALYCVGVCCLHLCSSENLSNKKFNQNDNGDGTSLNKMVVHERYKFFVQFFAVGPFYFANV